MNKKLDASNDQGFVQLNRLLGVYGPLPDYAKAADIQETTNPSGVLSDSYADPLHLQFPIHTKAACYVSTMYFLDNVGKLAPAHAERISQGLEKAAAAHGILADVEKLVQRCDTGIKTAAAVPTDDASYALVKRSASGTERRYPLRNALEVKAAAEWFSRYRDHFNFEDRQHMAERILDKAAEYGAGLGQELDYFLDKQAGRGVYDPQQAATQLRRRASLPGVAAPLRAGLEKLAGELLADPLLAEDPTTTMELAKTMDIFDREHNVKYSAVFMRPEDVLFSGSLKYAQCFMDSTCPTITGSIYDKSQFSKLSLVALRTHLGDDIAAEVNDGIGLDTEKLAEIVTTLPLPDAVRFDKLMSALGESPIHNKAAAVELTPEDREAAAREYQGKALANSRVTN